MDTAGLPMTPQAEVLAGRDASDVPMLLLAGVITLVVIIGTDADLVDSGLAVSNWIALRAALGDMGVNTLLHRIARTPVRSREPLTRTAIVERLGEAFPGAGHRPDGAVLDVLTAHAMFVDVTGRGHWQVGRLGGW
ncbi:hypothetical protein ABZ446_44865 [Streptomyces sp. NPDC005813]|uniref:hypothetical protein n=1 Tax=Streptomyces sp. NPDC005813 TaxID=3155592 RepID=UPI0033DC2602